MPKTHVSIYLAKEGKGSEDLIKGLSHKPNASGKEKKKPPLSMSLGDAGTLYYVKSKPNTPSWVTSFFGSDLGGVFTSSTASAVLPVRVRDRVMALAFGYGRNLIDLDAVEDRFGLRVVLNTCKENEFRKANTTSVAGNAGKNAEQLPHLANLSDFSIDNFSDTLDRVDARPTDDDIFEGMVSGGDALGFSTDRDVHTIVSLLEDILERYEKPDYKESYPWVDNVSPVKDSKTIEALEKRAVELLNAGAEDVWTAPAELVENWDRIGGFRWKGTHPDADHLMRDILAEDVVGSFRNGLKEYKQLKSKYVEALDADDFEKVRFTWSLAKCLYGEVVLGDSHYCVNAGKWYQVEKGYAQDINRRYEAVDCYDVSGFPKYMEDDNEGRYNERLANSNKSFLLMDQRTIFYGLSHSQVELCDVLGGTDTFIHVKHYSGSATLSHLFAQGYNSALLVRTDPDFVAKANEKVAKYDEDGSHRLVSGNVGMVVYLILCERAGGVPHIPFFSRISYLETVRRLRAMGVEARICSVYAPNKKKHKAA